MRNLLTLVKENKKAVLAFGGVVVGLVAGALLLNKSEEQEVVEAEVVSTEVVETEQV